MSTGSIEVTPEVKRVLVKLAEEAKGGKRDVLFDGGISHPVDDAALTVLLKQATLEQWKTKPVTRNPLHRANYGMR
ncbi:MAG: hypothetical protein HQK89_00725 [Nitrospirae bacterium]|nr:hypothetical protein [Nitrospirota bacterium]